MMRGDSYCHLDSGCVLSVGVSPNDTNIPVVTVTQKLVQRKLSMEVFYNICQTLFQT